MNGIFGLSEVRLVEVDGKERKPRSHSGVITMIGSQSQSEER